jgi:hypothetical protein
MHGKTTIKKTLKPVSYEQYTVINPARRNLGRFLKVPTFVARCLHVGENTRDRSGER